MNEIDDFAKKLAKELKGGEILALVGDLGSGKTTFTKALGKALNIKANIISPTFILMNVFPAKLPGQKGKPIYLYHLDLYRTKNFREVKALGITEVWGEKDTVTVIEWADKIKKYLPKEARFIYFKTSKERSVP